MTGYDPAMHDRWLDPPELPTHAACDGCGDILDTGDLTKIGIDCWMCDTCFNTWKKEKGFDDEG